MGDKGIRQINALILFARILLTQEAIFHTMPLTASQYTATAMSLCKALSAATGTAGRAFGVVPGTQTTVQAAG